jgi:hypothetical protein
MYKLKFWEDQLPNGQITQSSNRLIFLAGWIMIFVLVVFMLIFNKTDYALLGILITAVTGQKMYQKSLETSNYQPPSPIEQARIDYRKLFGVDAPEGKTLEEITNAINTNTPLI